MSYFPFFLDLTKFHCLVIGGGEIALNKVCLLTTYHATITVVAPQIHAKIEEKLTPNTHSTIHQRAFKPSDLDHADLVIIATNDDTFNTRTWQLAKTKNKIVNVVDDKEKCDFIFPGIVSRGELTVAISTSGVAPTISSWLRNKLETQLPQSWRAIMHSLKQQQNHIRQQLPDTRHRRRFYRSLIDHVLPYFLKAPQDNSFTRPPHSHAPRQTNTHNSDPSQSTPSITQHIDNSIIQHLHHHSQTPDNPHTSLIKRPQVYLVGAGPGDPELLTLRAMQTLQQADVILYDRLINDSLLDYTRRDAIKIYVGKQAHNHSKSQAQINQLLIEYAKKNNIVVRLKGGDPFIFGRGGEEMKALEKHHINVEIIPGVSAINGIAANLGIPLTLRGIADKLLLTSVYATQTHTVNWQQLTQQRQTLVLYMGLQNLPEISRQLITHGHPANTPIALIEKGTFCHQKTHYSTLQHTQSPSYIGYTQLQSPVLSIIGEVINHRKTPT